jgi:hypothetical protein
VGRLAFVFFEWKKIMNSWEKAEVGKAPAPILSSIGDPLQFLGKALKDLDDDIDGFIRTNPTQKEDRALLESIPGVGSRVSALMISLPRRNSFASAEQLAAYLGRVPVEKHSRIASSPENVGTTIGHESTTPWRRPIGCTETSTRRP